MVSKIENEVIERIAEQRILVFGDIMLDHYVWGDATRISPEAPVPVVSVFRDSHTVGGAANVARNLRGLGSHVELSGTVGNDDTAKTLRNILSEDGIEFSELWSKNDVRTILKTRVVVQKQQLCRIDREDSPFAYAISAEKFEATIAEKIRKSDAVIVSDYAKGVVDETIWNLIRGCARKENTFLALDPKPRRHLAFENPDLLTPNRSEALELAGISVGLHDCFPAEAVCKAIWEKYHPVNLVVTLGADGMLLSKEGKVDTSIPTVAQEVFDVSGAGDTVISTLAAALSAGANLETAAHIANAAAGVVVGKIGTAAITMSELRNALEGPEQASLS
ncbi:bifunctional ADP-heptose synthase [Rubellicoccus peritrichatus]|uniref:Bifunctional ADP-heptose synthase n=1 Tax=Rubellicoccus peritrichatus TaxID=3080537 RepID=A0AAQ3QST3_9BACT|nr:bifunctional ADP-heptose synthase [Puniceicoccus sp. CR14]WOO42908.1 bifunctional ADP-heptose synthase [Puniceicoccus sp. CR14]